jgi:hypothetical protein
LLSAAVDGHLTLSVTDIEAQKKGLPYLSDSPVSLSAKGVNLATTSVAKASGTCIAKSKMNKRLRIVLLPSLLGLRYCPKATVAI